MAGIIGLGMFYLIAILLCFTGPLALRIFIFIVSLLVPDPIPLVDELLMGAGVISKIQTTIRVLGVMRTIGKIIKLIIILGILALVINAVIK